MAGARIVGRLGGYLARQPLGLVALVLVVGGGSAYAADQLARNSVRSKHIKNGAVKGVDLRNRAVTAKKLATGAVTVTKLGDGAVTVTKIGDGQVTGAKLGDGQVTGSKLADDSVSGAKIADGQVTGADIADLSIGASDLDPGTIGDVISASGTLPNTATNVDILAVDGFGVLKGNCGAAGNLGFFYELNSPVQQKARGFGHDQIDNSPVGSAGISGTAGGVGYGGSGHQLLEGQVWSFTAERVLTIEISIDLSCIYRVRATLDHNDAG